VCVRVCERERGGRGKACFVFVLLSTSKTVFILNNPLCAHGWNSFYNFKGFNLFYFLNHSFEDIHQLSCFFFRKQQMDALKRFEGSNAVGTLVQLVGSLCFLYVPYFGLVINNFICIFSHFSYVSQTLSMNCINHSHLFVLRFQKVSQMITSLKKLS
jgi:hypothetical protein